ncbi:MAG: YkvA family protein [Porphyromonas sp.]|nr:YkvA family protein [Porphyromonas sp.]
MMSTKQILEGFRGQWLSKATEYVGNPARIGQLLSDATGKLNISAFSAIKSRLMLLIAYIKDVTTGKYKGYSATNLALAVAALIYLVSPVDFLPDLMPIIGWTDDAAVLTFALQQLASELDKYERNRG